MVKPGRPKTIPIAEIRLDGDMQVRVRTHEDTIADYAEAYRAGEKLPAVLLFWDGVHYWLADGFHRVAGARRAGRDVIPAQVQRGTRTDAMWAALGANRANGLRMTNEDKARAVRRALQMRPQMSNRAIAGYVGVSEHTVAKYRGELESTAQIAQSDDIRVGRDGRTINTANIGATATSVPPPPPMEDDPPTENTPAAPPAPDGPPPMSDEAPGTVQDGPPPMSDDGPPPMEELPLTYEPEGEAGGLRDGLGNPVTHPGLAEALRRDSELVQFLTALSRVKSAVLAAIDRQDPLFQYITRGRFQAEVSNAHGSIGVARPYAVCPHCGGDGSCRVCGDSGWVNKGSYDVAPRELRQMGSGRRRR